MMAVVLGGGVCVSGGRNLDGTSSNRIYFAARSDNADYVCQPERKLLRVQRSAIYTDTSLYTNHTSVMLSNSLP